MASDFVDLAGDAVSLDPCAVKRTADFIRKNFDRIHNRNFLTVIDYSKPSSVKRMYVFNFFDWKVDRYHVAHGKNSGFDVPTAFGDEFNSEKTSLGFYLTGDRVVSGKRSIGKALRLMGVDTTNKNAYDREIIMHCAPYVSLDFLLEHRRMGRSWGCPAVDCKDWPKLRYELANGSVLYHHHHKLCGAVVPASAVPTVVASSSAK
jgi:hypothetical protein